MPSLGDPSRGAARVGLVLGYLGAGVFSTRLLGVSSSVANRALSTSCIVASFLVVTEVASLLHLGF